MSAADRSQDCASAAEECDGRIRRASVGGRPVNESREGRPSGSKGRIERRRGCCERSAERDGESVVSADERTRTNKRFRAGRRENWRVGLSDLSLRAGGHFSFTFDSCG